MGKIGLRGTTWESLKRTPSLIPLYVVLSFGVGLAIWYPLRCLAKAPEVKILRHKNPEPWEEYRNKQYKFINASGFDYENYQHPAPKY